VVDQGCSLQALAEHKSINAIPELDIGFVFANFLFMNQPS